MLQDPSVSSETKMAAVDTVMPPGYSLVRRKSRTGTERVQAIRVNLELLNKLAQSIGPDFSNLERRIAYYALLFHDARTLRAINDLETRENKQAAIVEALEPLRQEVDTLSISLTAELKKTTVGRRDGLPVVIFGVGPAGFCAAVTFLNDEEFKGRVIIISDKYAEFPTRSGVLDSSATQAYAQALGISGASYEKLEIFFTIRQHLELSIKHVDIAGRAIYLALGGEIVQGRVDSYDQMSLPQGKQYLSLTLNAEEGSQEKIIIPNVSCVFNTAGFNTFYPGEIKRQQLSKVPPKERIKSIKADVLIPAKFFLQLRPLALAGFSFFLIPILKEEIFSDSIFLVKTQFFLFLTTKENDVLERVVSRYNLSPEQRILLKLKLYIDYLHSVQGGAGAALDWSGLVLRDHIKLGKQFCCEFDGSEGTAPPQKIVTLFWRSQASKTVATWAGASAMPPVLNGKFIQYAAVQAKKIVDQLVETKFAPGEHAEGARAHFDGVIQKVSKRIAGENREVDTSADLTIFLKRRMERSPGQDGCRLL